MRKLERKPLSTTAGKFLEGRTQQVLAAEDRAAEAQRLWKQRGSDFDEIRATLGAMAPGRQRCMYCEDNAGTDIEHFWPKSSYPQKAFTWLNYLLACSGCNSNFKRDQFPLDDAGRPLLIDPTAEEPQEHLALSATTGMFTSRTPKGQKSIEVFELNRDVLEQGRYDAWGAIESFLITYEDACVRGDVNRAERVRQWVRRYPFSSVFVWFLRYATRPDAGSVIDARCLAVLDKYPDIQHWL
ncbi:HNH endonuclease family protein [Pyxidicoccus xibeiensis]|uniref:hypothetical protein n=1 Tax=Pyxidicoccus xibeiensis TaxID=2906759 RepID=UPI0020A752C6|nr:hypothetical protein [Pyxidicoccus xibeiensis]MCP3136571.1 hypothetical protein [Pyxidicoccus xibeiensis]